MCAITNESYMIKRYFYSGRSFNAGKIEEKNFYL